MWSRHKKLLSGTEQLMKHDDTAFVENEELPANSNQWKCCFMLCICPWAPNELQNCFRKYEAKQLENDHALTTLKKYGQEDDWFQHSTTCPVRSNISERYPNTKVSFANNSVKNANNNQDDHENSISRFPAFSKSFISIDKNVFYTSEMYIFHKTARKIMRPIQPRNYSKITLRNISKWSRPWIKWEDLNFRFVLGIDNKTCSNILYLTATSKRRLRVKKGVDPLTCIKTVDDSRLFKRFRSPRRPGHLIQHIETKLYLGFLRRKRRKKFIGLVEEEKDAICWEFAPPK